MYIRFITEFINEYDEKETGVFQALGFLLRSYHVQDYDATRLEEIRTWFSKYLDKPTKFNKSKSKNNENAAICWYKSNSKEHIKRMYDLIPIFENYDIVITVIKRENPGYIIYEDKYQIATLPLGKDKNKVR